MKTILVAGLLVALCFVVAPAMAATLYVDRDGQADATGCAGTTAAFSTIQGAINAAGASDMIMVCPGTYDPIVYPLPPGWGGSYPAQGVVVWKDGLTIKAVDPDPANTIIENTINSWMDWWRIQYLTGGVFTSGSPVTLTGGFNPQTSAAPNAVMVVSDGVTIDGFTIRSTYTGDSVTAYPNSAGVFIGGVAAGDQKNLGVTGTTVKNCVITGHSGIYNWRASDTLIEGNTVRVLDSDLLANTMNGNGVVVWDGWFEGFFPPTSTGVRILNNNINTCNVNTASGDEGKGIMFGGTQQITCTWCPPANPLNALGSDQSGMLIDGNTICAASSGIKFWNSIGDGASKLITCDNTITFGTYRIHDYGLDEGYPPSTWTEESPCGPTPVPEFPTVAVPVLTITGMLVMVLAARRMK